MDGPVPGLMTQDYAPDAALCQDVITRMCLARTCAGVNEQLALGAEDLEASVLAEVAIEGEGGADATALHDRERDRVAQAEVLVVELRQDRFRPFLVAR